MSNTTLRVVVWLAFTIQLLVGGAVLRRKLDFSAIVVLNLVAAACVVAYWGRRWFSYLFRGITWYASDQWMPACALLVCLLAVLSLTGRYQGHAVHWIVFGLNTLVLIGAVLFATFFKMTRLF